MYLDLVRGGSARRLRGASVWIPVVVAAVAAAVFLPGRFADPPTRVDQAVPAHGSAAATTPGTAAAPSSGTSAADAGARPVPIPGRLWVAGVRMGFPHTTWGALSAAVEYRTQLGSTFDTARAETVMRLVGNPSWTDGPATYARSVADRRAALGLPRDGEPPGGASVVLTPVQYQVRAASTDRVMVLLLCTESMTLPGQPPRTAHEVYAMDMHWTAGDWRLLAPGQDEPSYRALAAPPGSPDAAAKGWRPLGG
ncbi:hypothetical protein [Yinghuangia soli]|uniref:DUF8175 domain-containing protein n=1 Tax=Yinghuangia soli TaxID=2908204 RepID=A0AA41Q8P9_9ACTN|nr:hypothetical protein [Yinghuangia soli]MCF2532419.1 hypothetical protein [Yinghuangia soli]